MPYPALRCAALSCPASLYPILLCAAMSCLAQRCAVLSCPVLRSATLLCAVSSRACVRDCSLPATRSARCAIRRDNLTYTLRRCHGPLSCGLAATQRCCLVLFAHRRRAIRRNGTPPHGLTPCRPAAPCVCPPRDSGRREPHAARPTHSSDTHPPTTCNVLPAMRTRTTLWTQSTLQPVHTTRRSRRHRGLDLRRRTVRASSAPPPRTANDTRRQCAPRPLVCWVG